MHAQFKDIKDCLAIHFESQAPEAEASSPSKTAFYAISEADAAGGSTQPTSVMTSILKWRWARTRVCISGFSRVVGQKIKKVPAKKTHEIK